MIEMRESLPSEFQQFIKALAKSPAIRDYCIASGNMKITSEFNRCTTGLKEFRDLHIQIATHYIVLQRKSQAAIVGTGGTDLVPFLKQTRQETVNAAIDI
jgi:indoleamine 2,3-dioxygenase